MYVERRTTYLGSKRRQILTKKHQILTSKIRQILTSRVDPRTERIKKNQNGCRPITCRPPIQMTQKEQTATFMMISD